MAAINCHVYAQNVADFAFFYFYLVHIQSKSWGPSKSGVEQQKMATPEHRLGRVQVLCPYKRGGESIEPTSG